jgi:hypothetical protein
MGVGMEEGGETSHLSSSPPDIWKNQSGKISKYTQHYYEKIKFI